MAKLSRVSEGKEEASIDSEGNANALRLVWHNNDISISCPYIL